MAKPFLTAEWRWLAMLNYEVDPAILTPYLPAAVELDQFHGRTLASMVAFRFLNTRVMGLPVPGHRNFDEVNLRFYVRRVVGDEIRRGVVFIREIVPRRAIAWAARTIYEEPYAAAPMRHRLDYSEPTTDASTDGPLPAPSSVQYEWKHRGKWNELAATLAGTPRLPDQGSEEEFITEHYWGYTKRRSRATSEYRVEHPQWRVWRAESPKLDCDIASLYGAEFREALSAKPSSAFVAEGSDVSVYPGERIT